MFELFEQLSRHDKFLHEIRSAASYRPIHERGDEGWIGRFADDGGQVIISGDSKMRARKHELIALCTNGLITYFFDRRWGQQDFYVKSAMMLKWWPQISKHMITSDVGRCWEIPFVWNRSAFKDVTPPTDIT